jgi:hypothetical protein
MTHLFSYLGGIATAIGIFSGGYLFHENTKVIPPNSVSNAAVVRYLDVTIRETNKKQRYACWETK